MRPNFRPKFKKSYHDTIEPRRRFLYEAQRMVVAATATLVTYKRTRHGRRPPERLVANYAARLG